MEPTITSAQIGEWGRPKYEDSDELLAMGRTIKQERHPVFLKDDEFDKILHWKLRGQYGRGRELRKPNTPELVKHITEAALNLTHEDKDYETELRLNLLCSLRGVGIPVASAILAIVYPETYGIIDIRVWQVLYGCDQEGSNFTVRNYLTYLHKIQMFAKELGWTVQEIDLALWTRWEVLCGD